MMKKVTGYIHELLYLFRVIPACSTACGLNHRVCYLNRCSFVQVNFTGKTNRPLLFIPRHTDQNIIKFIIRSSNVCNHSWGQQAKFPKCFFWSRRQERVNTLSTETELAEIVGFNPARDMDVHSFIYYAFG